VLDGTPVHVVLPAGTPQWRHQILALALVDLLGRLFPAVIVHCDPDAVAHDGLPPGPALLVERLSAACAHGGLRPGSGPNHPPVTVVIGADTADIAGEDHPRVLHVDGGGWQSYNGTLPSRLPDCPWPLVPVGPLAAACRAAGQVASAALADLVPDPSPEPSAYASALTHRSDVDPFDEGPQASTETWQHPLLQAIMAGAGSVGGAAAYTFAMTPALAGELVVTDPQRLEDKNLDRALLATAAATHAGQWKADAAKNALEHQTELKVNAHIGTLSDYVASRPRYSTLPLVLCSVDSADARRSVQDCLPLELVNAACHPEEISVSGHRTGAGPCVCCLHMEQVLDADNIKIRLLARATGLNERMITEFLVKDVPLQSDHLRQIERHRGLATGTLDRYRDRTLDALRAGELLYGETPVTTASGSVAVAAPFVTALAGVLLAAEALKAAVPALAAHRLGPHGAAVKYEENRRYGPQHAMLSRPARWPTSECLCRSTRRQRIITARYGLAPST